MVDGDVLSRILDKLFTLGGAAFLAAMAFIAHLFRIRNERLRDIAAEKAGDWDRIRSERDVAREERDMVRDKWAECEAERVKWMGRAVKAESFLEGLGEAKQDAARIVAIERLIDAGKKPEAHRDNGGSD